MKEIIILFFITLSNPLLGQSNMIYIPSIENEGVIFDSSLIAPIYRDFKIRTNPNTSEIIEAERILQEGYLEINQADKYNYNPSLVEKLRKEYAEAARQYFGFIDSLNNKCIFIHILTCRSEECMKYCYSQTYKKEFMVIFDENGNCDTKSYIVNLTNRKISRPFFD